MYAYNKNNKRKIAHSTDCRFIQGIDKRDLGFFKTRYDVVKSGFRLCKCCTHTARLYRKQRFRFLKECKKLGYTASFYNDVIEITTPFSKYKIFSKKNKNTFILYHKNSIYSIKNEPSVIPGYHSQNFRSKDLLLILDYIKQHDRYRIEHPYENRFIASKTRREHNEDKRKHPKTRKKEKNHRKRERIKLVLTMIEQLEKEKK